MKEIFPLFTKKIVCAAAISAAMTVTAHANATTNFLKSIEGSYTGKGEAVMELTNNKEQVSCSLNNEFDADKKVLTMAGKCASVRGQTRVNGKLRANGNSVSGSFISPVANQEVTQSDGRVSGGRMIISTSMVDKSSGSLTRVRYILKRSGSGFTASFQQFDNSSNRYTDTGSVTFERK